MFLSGPSSYSMLFQCDVKDCTLPSSSCFAHNIVKLIRDWKECGQKKCTYDTVWCATIDDQIIVDEVFPGLNRMLIFGEKYGIKPKSRQIFSSAFNRYSGFLLVKNSSQQCNTSTAKGHSDAPQWSNITCDSTKQTYQRTTTHTSFNSVILVSLVFALFGSFIALFGGFESFHFQWSVVRVGCCIVGLLMSSLVYIGSLHLYWSSIEKSVQHEADLQMGWRTLYLVISYMCLHGGLLVLVPNVAADDGDRGTHKSATVATNQDLICSLCGNATCCRRGSCCFKTLHFFKSFKDSFWDASGTYFFLKLMIMEVVEVAIQINSLTRGAKKSQVNDVVLSAIIIAANLIVLPLVIVLGPKCIKSSASSSDVSIAAVMVIEVLFDKLYVGVGVLLRYDTFTRSMKLTDQIAVHLALLLPALMTALDVQDALVLAEHMEATSVSGKSDSVGNYRSSSFARVAGKVNKVTGHPIVLMTFKMGLFLSAIIGIVLATYTSIAATMAHTECERRIGAIASCAKEQYYFIDGFFQQTNCAFEQVTAFKCKLGQCLLFSCSLLRYYMMVLDRILICCFGCFHFARR